jgi:high-affinity iron transporter
VLGSALIVFREVLEAALVIGIACAATRGIAGRNAWVLGGIAAGATGACVVAAFASAIADSASGMGQEIFNAGVLLAAVAMLGWHNVWMARHGRELAQQMSALGKSVQSGNRPLYALGVVIALAVLREGAEVALFLYGLAAGGSSNASLLAGSGIGLVAGAALGVALYLGLLRIPTKHFFTVTSWMILLLAAGMASQAAGFLIQADYLPALGEALWDSSGLIAHDSMVGEVLRALVGYDAQPAGMQLVFWLVTLGTIGVAMKLYGKPPALDGAAAGAR